MIAIISLTVLSIKQANPILPQYFSFPIFRHSRLRQSSCGFHLLSFCSRFCLWQTELHSLDISIYFSGRPAFSIGKSDSAHISRQLCLEHNLARSLVTVRIIVSRSQTCIDAHCLLVLALFSSGCHCSIVLCYNSTTVYCQICLSSLVFVLSLSSSTIVLLLLLA